MDETVLCHGRDDTFYLNQLDRKLRERKLNEAIKVRISNNIRKKLLWMTWRRKTWAVSTPGIAFLTLTISWKSSCLLFFPFLVLHVYGKNSFSSMNIIKSKLTSWWELGIMPKIENNKIQTWLTQTSQGDASILFALINI